jgi:SAM-dependent methyltransferase
MNQFSALLEEHREIIRCPLCRGHLNSSLDACLDCQAVYEIGHGVPHLMKQTVAQQALQDQDSDSDNALKNFFKRWPRLYKFIVWLIVPILYTGLTAKKFLFSFPDVTRLLVVGSGNCSLHPKAINVDLFSFPNVHVVATAEALPFADESFDGVCTEQVLEHVFDARAVAHELLRVTHSGGLIYTAVPFFYPYHASPKDYSRWTVDGIIALFGGRKVVDSGILIGPVSGSLVAIAAFLAILFSFGFTPLRKILNYFFSLLLSPLRVLDFVYARLPGAEELAVSIYVVIKK